MKKLLILMLLALPLAAQTVHTFPALDTDNEFTGPDLFHLLQMYNRTVSQLSALTPKRNGLTELITDGTDSKDCTVGGGSSYVLCYYKTADSTWHPYFTGAGSLVSFEWLPPLFSSNCADPTTCSDIITTKMAVNPFVVYGGPTGDTGGLPYPTNFTVCSDYTGSLSSATCTYTQSVDAGTAALPHHLVACVKVNAIGGPTITGVSDTLTNTWSTTGSSQCRIAHNVGNGPDAVTFSFSGTTSYEMVMYEEIGADADNPIDTSLNSSSSGTTGTQTWTVTTTQPDGYTLAIIAGGAGGLGYQEMSPTATYNQDIQGTHYGGAGTGTSFIGSLGWGQLASTGSQSITTFCTALSGGTCTNVGFMVAFKPAGPSVPGFPNFLYLRYLHLVAGGDFPPISSGDAGKPLVVDATGTKIELGSVPGTSVSSITGDGALINNSASTGAVTLTLGNATKYQFWGRNAGTTGAPGYFNLPTSTFALATDVDGQVVAATRLGNTSTLATTSGTPATDDCAKFDSNHNLVSAGAACGTASGSFSVNGSLVAAPNINDTTPAAATNGYNVKWQASGSSVSGYIPAYGTIKYGFAFQGAVGASATGLIQVAAASTLPANLTTPTTTCKCGTNPTSSFAITLKDGASTVGTITLDSSCAATLATTGGTTQALAADDQLYAVAPGSADATAANISCLVRASRN